MNVFEHQYQLAYVTADLDVGMGVLAEELGIGRFTGFGGMGVVERRVHMSGGDVSIASRTAIARFGDVTIEVFEPVSGATRVFTEMLVAGAPVRLHHVGMRCEDLDAMRAEHERHGRTVALSGEVGPARFMYVDARDTLGHYLEYVSAPSDYWQH